MVGLLLTARRGLRLAGLAVALAGAALAFVPIFPDLGAGLIAAAAAGGLIAVAAAALALRRWPWLLPTCALACVPVRLPIDLGGQDYNLLVPLYLVIGAATLVLAYELLHGDERSRELGPIAWPLAAFVAWSAISLAWSGDVREGAIMLDAFLIPFTLLAVALARLAWPRRLLLALLGELAAMALVFTVVGIYQWQTREVFWTNPKLNVSNAYAPFFRVNSVFWDPSVYGRFLVVAMLACLVLVIVPAGWRWALAATASIALLWIGLLLSFSQSSFAALAAGAIAAALVIWRRQAAIPLAVTAVVIGMIGLVTPQLRDRVFDGGDGGLNRLTSTRTTLVDRGARIAADHPLVGVGLGGFKQAYADRQGLRGKSVDTAASHTTPITVAAESGVAGLVLYGWLLAIVLVTAFERAGSSFDGRVQLACALGLTAIAVHSLFYASFFEDPMLWLLLAIVAALSSADGAAPAPSQEIPRPREASLR